METRIFKPTLKRMNIILLAFGICLLIWSATVLLLRGFRYPDNLFSCIVAICAPLIIIVSNFIPINFVNIEFTNEALIINRYVFKNRILPYASIQYQYKELIVFDKYSINLDNFRNKEELLQIIDEYKSMGLLELPLKTELSKMDKHRKALLTTIVVAIYILFIFSVFYFNEVLSDYLMLAFFGFTILLVVFLNSKRRT